MTINQAELRGRLAEAGFTRLVADYVGDDQDTFEPGWRIHDMPENSAFATFLAEGLEEAQAALIVAAVNALPALLDRVGELERALVEASKMLRGAAGAIGDGTTLGGLAAAHIMKQAADKYDGLTALHPKGDE